MKPMYNENLEPDEQIEAEEKIAAIIFDGIGTEADACDEEKAQDLSKKILMAVLQQFRPDLIETP